MSYHNVKFEENVFTLIVAEKCHVRCTGNLRNRSVSIGSNIFD